MNHSRQIALIILDGWGHREEKLHNAIAVAHTPSFDRLWEDYPHALLDASGAAVGLPDGQMGNSEVGHTTIGAGRAIDTDLVRIGKAIADGTFDLNPTFQKLFAHVRRYDSVLHVQGLLSDGGVHSHQDHLVAFLRLAKKEGIQKVALHLFTDGRDVAPRSALHYIKSLENIIADIGVGRIVSLSGRFYAMDRDSNWDRIEKTGQVLFDGQRVVSKSPSVYIQELYDNGVFDEYFEPIVFSDGTKEISPIGQHDGVFFFNFRADRARMLSRKILDRVVELDLCFVTMTAYGTGFETEVAFPPVSIETQLAAELARAGHTQAHIAETEKYAHVTYFFNGKREICHEGECHVLIESRRDVPTHDHAPQMRAKEIAEKTIDEIKKGTNFILVNFANPDMVGHTANIPAIIEAVEEVDRELGTILTALKEAGGTAIVTADHGNAELNIDLETGEKHTAHTTNPVPIIITDQSKTIRNGGLADIAPTVLGLFGLPKPGSMTGESLLGI